MACVEICPVQAISMQDDMSAYNAVIDENKCVHCNLCHTKCQNNQSLSFTPPIFYKQGWTNDEGIRKISTSGGLSAELINAFLKNGGTVCSCAFMEGEVRFAFTAPGEAKPAYQGSKYVKSNPLGIYKKIEALLKGGTEVLFVGLPCQVGALKAYLKAPLQEKLTTVDIICHGTPAPKTLDAYLSQLNCSLSTTNSISFRRGKTYAVSADGKGAKAGTSDYYSLGFLSGLFFTENCYDCKYAKRERASDITIGDSWGSDLPIEQQRKGLSLILCQTEKGKALLDACDLTLHDVDYEKAARYNGQLNAPMTKPKNREKFFIKLAKGKSFDSAVFACMPKKCLKQKVKRLAYLLHVKR